MIAAALLMAAAASAFPLAAGGQQATQDTGSVSRSTPENFFGTSNDAQYDVAFRQASLREVLQFMAWIAEANIVIPEGLEGVVNVSFKDILLGDAINSIIKANDLEYTREGRIIRIGKAEQFKESGEDLKTETFRLRYASAKEMASKCKPLLSSRGQAINDDRTNSVIIRDLPANIENVSRFVQDVDIKDAQVLIESKIVETTRSFSRALGIQWGMNKTGGNVQIGGITAVGQDDAGRNLNVNLTSGSTPTSGLLLGSVFKGVNLDVQILAAEQRGDAYIVSDPSIVTTNGKQANIRSGATLLVQGSSTVNIGTSGSSSGETSAGGGLQEIETGVELRVTPQITINDFVKLDIEAITSTPDFSRTIQGVPIVVDNKAQTTVLVKDGETTVIGGLSRFTDSLQNRRVPYFSKIPILGNLFKSKDRTADNSELMVFIKPSIVRGDGQEPAQVRVRKVEERKDAMYLEPILTPETTDKEKVARQRETVRGRRGNKYVK